MTPTPRGNRCAIYVRVSTDKQANENQEVKLRALCVSQGWEVVAVYRDVISGTSTRAERTGFDAMMTAAENGEFDILLFWALDRITRNGALETLTILKHLADDLHIEWRSLQEPYLDTMGDFGEAIISLLGTVAKLERKRISERTKDGLARTKAAGTKLGHPLLEFDEARARELRAAGMSYNKIAKELGVNVSVLFRRIGGDQGGAE